MTDFYDEKPSRTSETSAFTPPDAGALALRTAPASQSTGQVTALAQKSAPQSHALPRALMPWADLLDLFPREIATALGPLLQRLDLVIGPLRVQGKQGTGDPDGFYGITRRGNYERLLLSEWLLAEELPEEFARRAAMGEHGFLELARREPVGARTSVALFDAGPNQLGSPRIAHLAALIILARRAAAAGAGFQWGVLQQPTAALHTDVTARTILHLLQARSYREATDEELAAWREKVGSQMGADDLWIVGGQRLARLPAVQGASRLHIREAEELESRTLIGEVHEKGRVKPPVLLELPEAAVCVRLLREPFPVRVAEPSRHSVKYAAPTSNLLFTVGGTRLLARSGQDHLLVYPIPALPQAGAGKPKVYHAKTPAPILAAGGMGRSIALVTMTKEPDVLLLECVGPRSDRFLSLRFRLPAGMTVTRLEVTDPLTSCFYLGSRGKNGEWLIQIKDSLLHLSRNPTSPEEISVSIMMERVAAAGLSSSGPCFIGDLGTSEWKIVSCHEAAYNKDDLWDEWLFSHCEFENIENAYFGYGAEIAHPEYGLAAVEETVGEWKILHREEMISLFPFEKDQVVGVIALSEGRGIGDTTVEPGLIVLQPDRRKIKVEGWDWTREVPLASSAITQITASPYGPEIAYFTVQGELVVYSLWQEKVLYRLETRPR